MILYWATLAVVAVVVLALAGYLIAVAVALIRARSNVSDLADGLEAVADATAVLDDRIRSINEAMGPVATSFRAVDEDLDDAAAIFKG